MPLRDHFHPPLSDLKPRDRLHGAWPTVIVIALNKWLPPAYSAAPHVHLSSGAEVDIAAVDDFQTDDISRTADDSEGGTATAVWAPPKPTLSLDTVLRMQDEYEVHVFDQAEGRLVAAIEIVSPSNKDRLEHRRSFVGKCAALLQQNVCVSIVDLVSSRRANLYTDILELLGKSDPSFGADAISPYAATLRLRPGVNHGNLETWAHELELKSKLPTLPVWLSDSLAIPLELEKTYEETCRVLRIPV